MSIAIICPKCRTRLKKLAKTYKIDDAFGTLYECGKCDKRMLKNNWYGYFTIIKDEQNDKNCAEPEKKLHTQLLQPQEINPIPKTKPLVRIRRYY